MNEEIDGYLINEAHPVGGFYIDFNGKRVAWAPTVEKAKGLIRMMKVKADLEANPRSMKGTTKINF